MGEREFPELLAFHANRITYSIGPALVVAFGSGDDRKVLEPMIVRRLPSIPKPFEA